MRTVDAEYMTPGLRRWRRATDGPLLVIAIGSLPLLLLEFVRHELPHSDVAFIDAVNVFVLVVFAIDYVVELSLASNRRQWARVEWTSLVIVITQAIALLPGLAGFGALRVMRGAPALRSTAVIVRVLAVGGAAARDGRALLRRRAAAFAIGMAGLTWLTAAVAFTLVEDVGDGGKFESFFDALWWSTTTITTVGYGDVYPESGIGRIVGGFTMVVGISTFAVVTAKVAEFLVRADTADTTVAVDTLDETSSHA